MTDASEKKAQSPFPHVLDPQRRPGDYPKMPTKRAGLSAVHCSRTLMA